MDVAVGCGGPSAPPSNPSFPGGWGSLSPGPRGEPGPSLPGAPSRLSEASRPLRALRAVQAIRESPVAPRSPGRTGSGSREGFAAPESPDASRGGSEKQAGADTLCHRYSTHTPVAGSPCMIMHGLERIARRPSVLPLSAGVCGVHGFTPRRATQGTGRVSRGLTHPRARHLGIRSQDRRIGGGQGSPRATATPGRRCDAHMTEKTRQLGEFPGLAGCHKLTVTSCHEGDRLPPLVGVGVGEIFPPLGRFLASLPVSSRIPSVRLAATLAGAMRQPSRPSGSVARRSPQEGPRTVPRARYSPVPRPFDHVALQAYRPRARSLEGGTAAALPVPAPAEGVPHLRIQLQARDRGRVVDVTLGEGRHR